MVFEYFINIINTVYDIALISLKIGYVKCI